MAALKDWTERAFNSISLKEWNYDRLDQSELPEQSDEAAARKPASSSTRALVLKIGGALFLVVLFLFGLSKSTYAPKIEFSASTQSEGELKQSYLHVLFPSNEAGTSLCRTVFSAGALDWPIPRLLGWESTPDFKDSDDNARALFYVRNVLSWVNQLTQERQAEELVLILDSSDVWFQQRPAALISKYHAINARAQARIVSRLGSEAVAKTNMTQTIVFSAQRDCSWEDDQAIDCYAVPPSDLRGSVFGDDRDTTNRPHYLNTGSVMGPLGDIRTLFTHALDLLEHKSEARHSFRTAQDVFARIFGEQSYQREVIRARHITRWQKFISFFGHDPRDDILSPNYGREQMQGGKKRQENSNKNQDSTQESYYEATPFDFKIGIDYFGEISTPTLAQNDEFAWLEYGSEESVANASEITGAHNMHKLKVSEEVLKSAPPFWTPSYTGNLQFPLKKWSEVPLFTNVYTGVAPVAIHHRVIHGLGEDTLKTTWDKMWFYDYLRPMLVAKGISVRKAIAVVDGPKGREEYWSPEEGLAGMRIEDGGMPGGWRSWQDVCGTPEIATELFGDGKGAWKTPVYVPDDKGMAHEVLHNWMLATDGKLLLDVI